MKRPLVAVPGETLSGDGRAEAGETQRQSEGL